MTIRQYTAALNLPNTGPFMNLQYEKIKARSKKDAKVKGEELAKEKQGKLLAVYPKSMNEGVRKTLRAGHRNINPHLRPSFELKHRHKGRPLKGRRNVPYPKRNVSIRITNVEL